MATFTIYHEGDHWRADWPANGGSVTAASRGLLEAMCRAHWEFVTGRDADTETFVWFEANPPAFSIRCTHDHHTTCTVGGCRCACHGTTPAAHT